MQQNGTYDVKLGKSFLDKDCISYMTMRCDFMPTSVDKSKPGSIKVNDDKEVVVNLLNVATSGPESTVFRGIARPVQKECVLIYNKKTQELTLERISHTVQLKKTREERKSETVSLLHDSNNEANIQPHSVPRLSSSKRKGFDGGHSNTLSQTSSVIPKKVQSRTLSCSSDSSDSSVDMDIETPNVNKLNGSYSDSSLGCSSSDENTLGRNSGLNANIVDSNCLQSNAVHRKLIEHDLRLSDSDSG